MLAKAFFLLVAICPTVNSQKLQVNFPITEGKEWRLHDIELRNKNTLYLHFCHMEVGNYQREPWKTPMEVMMVNESKCDLPENFRRYSLPLLQEHQKLFPNEYLVPSGFIHHETRCGSTLFSNMIAHIPSALMVSEPPIPYKIFFNQDQWKALMTENEWREAVVSFFKAMCHTQHSHNRCFLKLPGAKYIKEFQDYFPNVPWIFLFRSPLDVVVSNMKGAWGKKDVFYIEGKGGKLVEKNTDKKIAAPCLQMQLPLNVPFGYYKNEPEKHCVAALDHLCRDAALELIRRPDLGLAVEYSNLPEVVYEHIWANHFKQSTDALIQDMPYMIEASRAYSKTMKKEKAEFNVGSDADLKEKLTSEAIREAVYSSNITDIYNELVVMQRWTKLSL